MICNDMTHRMGSTVLKKHLDTYDDLYLRILGCSSSNTKLSSLIQEELLLFISLRYRGSLESKGISC